MTLGEKFLKTSMIYFIVGITMGALFTIKSIKPVHDFVLQSPIFAGAHSHINLIGWVSLAIIGGIYMMIKDKPMHSEKIGNTGFWLLNSGISIMFILMLIAGYIGSSLAIAGNGAMIEAETSPYMILIMVFAIVIAIGAYLTVHPHTPPHIIIDFPFPIYDQFLCLPISFLKSISIAFILKK